MMEEEDKSSQPLCSLNTAQGSYDEKHYFP